MNIEQTKRTLKLLPPRQSVLLESVHGMGKSEVIAQVACELSEMLQTTFGFVDIRLGQYEVGDLVGLPEKKDTFTVYNTVYTKGKLTSQKMVAQDVTVHNLPLWFPKDKDSFGFLFFDELNRGSRETQQWAMQIVLDYRTNFNEVPPGWRIIAACNPNQDVYNVLGFDPALYDRFMVIKFEPTVKEWQNHAEKIAVHNTVTKYIPNFPRDLDPPENIETGKKYPSRRSWVKFSDTLKHIETLGENPLQDLDYLLLLTKSYVGEVVAVNYVEFIKKSYVVYTGKEIINNFPRLKEAFSNMQATDLTYYNKQVIEYIVKLKTPFGTKQSENLLNYIQTIPGEIAAGFWTAFRRDCPKVSLNWYESYGKKTVRKLFEEPTVK